MNKVYAYGITVGGLKRVGGTMRANDMEDAVRRIMKREKTLSIERKKPVFRICDGAMIPRAEWMFEGKRAFLYVFAPAEYFP